MYLSEKTHKSGQITVRLVAHSSSDGSPDIATFELEYPRFIHSELMTHRVFSRNAMSSRAVPISKMIDQVRTNPAMPIHWGKNQAGMQAKEELNRPSRDVVYGWWLASANEAADFAEAMDFANAHKQIVNRILEPYQRMKTIVTSTEWDNFFELRCHKDAQPEIKALADMMRDALSTCKPELLRAGEWHTPYVSHFRASDGYAVLEYHSGNLGISTEDALKVSASCCAQVSYRLLDNSLDKALLVYDRLVSSRPIHASPFEHQAMVMDTSKSHVAHPMDDIYGVTHQDVSGNYWSGNLRGWVQYRQLLA